MHTSVSSTFQGGAEGYGDVQSRYIKLRDALQQFE